MCEVCDKKIYFDKNVHYSDCGYGDNDYDEKIQFKVHDIICPACGKLKQSAIDIFGSNEKALIYLMTLNLEDYLDDKVYEDSFKNILEQSKLNRLEKVLEKNRLKIEDGKLVHICGHTLLTGLKDSNKGYSMVLKIESILESKSFNFCPCCGKKIFPLSKEIDMQPSEFVCTPL